ncbi:hypothetical protein, conserved [Eimeria necatrix]|uniref:DNA replication complex GINS protein SLD5 n=1 Tax=Eimeria necatrix TaxID=51315 RepID=U6MHN0_9EIME|nr:hypothetical protein, conserved [Eimeria necatrix]CDJ63767.1 hypothetical protein, conserved [Eimeria necatrix]
MSWEKSACLSRMPDEVRLLQQAETITDYPTQLLRTVEEELEEYHRQLQACNDFLNSVGPDTPPEEIEAHENRRQLMELDVLHALRVLKAFQRTRQHLLDRMCVKALGQFEAFDEQTLLKLSDNEIQYLREACAAEHSRRDEGNARNVEDRNGKPSAIADVVFEKDCVLEDPWSFTAASGPNEVEPSSAASPALAHYVCGTVSRMPLYRAVQLRAKGIVRVLQVFDHQWIPQDSAALKGFV